VRLRIEHAGEPVSARLISLSFTKGFNGRISDGSYQLLNAADPIQKTQVIVYNDEDGSKVIRGEIVNVQRENKAPGIDWTTVKLAGPEYLLPRAKITRTWTATKPRVILQDAFGDKLPAISTEDSTVEDLGSAIDLIAENMPLDSLVKQLAEITGAEWRLSEELELIFRAVKSHAAAFEIDQANPNGTTKFRCRGLKSGSDSVQFANRITVIGGYLTDGTTPLVGLAEDAASIADLGQPYEDVIPMQNLTTQAAVDEAAAVILENRLQYLKTIECIFDHGRPAIDYAPINEVPQPGDVLTVSAPNQANLLGDFQIQTITIRQVTPPNPENSDHAWTEVRVAAGEFPGSIVERLRSLTTKAKDGIDGKSAGTTTPPFFPPPVTTTPEDEHPDGICGKYKMTFDPCTGLVIRDMSAPMAIFCASPAGNRINWYRSFYRNGEWTERTPFYDYSLAGAGFNSGSLLQQFAGTGQAEYEGFVAKINTSGHNNRFIGAGLPDFPTPDLIDGGLSGNDFDLNNDFCSGRNTFFAFDAWWLIAKYVDRAPSPDVFYEVAIWKSTGVDADNRPTGWALQDLAGTPNNADAGFECHMVGWNGSDKIRVFGSFNGTDFNLWDFDLETAEWSSPYAALTPTLPSSPSWQGRNRNGIVERANGDIVVFYHDQESLFARVWNGSSWSAQIAFSDTDSPEWREFGNCVLDPNGDTVHVFWVPNGGSDTADEDLVYRPLVGTTPGSIHNFNHNDGIRNGTPACAIVPVQLEDGSYEDQLAVMYDDVDGEDAIGAAGWGNRVYFGTPLDAPVWSPSMVYDGPDDGNGEPLGTYITVGVDVDGEGRLIVKADGEGITAKDVIKTETGEHALWVEDADKKLVFRRAQLSSGTVAVDFSAELSAIDSVQVTLEDSGAPTEYVSGSYSGTTATAKSSSGGSSKWVHVWAIGDI